MPTNITEWIVRIPVLLFAITIHEYGHGKAALSLGDPTARDQGRLTLNPLSHLDPLGAVCLFLFNFGWAKPVPVDPGYFQNPRKDIVLMSMSGPVANLSAAFIAGIFIRHFLLPFEIYQKILIYLVLMNVGLGLFNLIPIPPLDGSHILENILPASISSFYRRFRRYGAFFLIAVVLLDNFAHTGILNRVLVYPMLALSHLFAGDNLYRMLRLL